MALTLPYPTMSAAFAPTGAATIDQFSPPIVHSDTVHNNPHAKLLANEVAIAAAHNTLDSTVIALAAAVSSISYIHTQTTAFTTSLGLPSAGTWVVRCDAFHFSNVVSAFTLTMDGVVVQTLQGLGDIPGAGYNNMFGYVTKTIVSSYSFVCTISTDASVYANTGRIGIIAFKIG